MSFEENIIEIKVTINDNGVDAQCSTTEKDWVWKTARQTAGRDTKPEFSRKVSALFDKYKIRDFLSEAACAVAEAMVGEKVEYTIDVTALKKYLNAGNEEQEE